MRTHKKEFLMKNTKTLLGIALMVMAVSSACTQQQYNDEKDFKVEKIDGGKGVEITKYVGEKFEVRIPPRIQGLPVTSIGKQAFEEKGITSVTIPNSVTSIWDGAFWGCTSLTSIIIPNSVTSIGDAAFSGCTSLTNITIPNSVTSIGNLAFDYCTSLTSITIPNSVTSIGDKAFYYCDSLTSVMFQGTIASEKFGGTYFREFVSPFRGDLREKYLAGGMGTYTTTAPVNENSKWTKQ
jgi:hypothetical protein